MDERMKVQKQIYSYHFSCKIHIASQSYCEIKMIEKDYITVINDKNDAIIQRQAKIN